MKEEVEKYFSHSILEGWVPNGTTNERKAKQRK
jgi:hypothetical protein